MTTAYEMEAPEIDGMYYIDIGTDKKWYVTRYENGYRNGGQDTREYEHNYGFASKAGAVNWAIKDAKKITDWNTKWNQ